jgi:hypothetical protein
VHKNKTTTHIRPIQTASIIGTNTNNNIRVVNNYKDIKDYINNDDSLIVWHHEEIPKILDYLTNKKNNFAWNDNNYSGCLIIDENLKNYTYIDKIY